MPYLKAKKRFGQHFMTDRRLAARIVKALNPAAGEEVVEIGPGKGILTELLLESNCRVTAIELDRELVAYLREKFEKNKLVTIINRDFLKIGLDELPSQMKLIGNIPYNISTAILEKLLDFRKSITCAVLTLQAEVADRLTARPGSRTYGSFTVIMAAAWMIKRLFSIKPGAFRPAPAVMSAAIKLEPGSLELNDPAAFNSFVRSCFYHKRKTLSNSMQSSLELPKNIVALGRELDVRAEQLGLDNYLQLFKLWSGKNP